MVKRQVFDNEKHVHFVTFSCYKRRTFLQQNQAKRMVIGPRRSDCLEGKSVGLPIRWPPGLETEDEFVVGT